MLALSLTSACGRQRLGDTSALALGKQERSVHDFRCYIVDGSSHILCRVEITAADLETAKRDAYGILQTRREQSVLPMLGIEIWRGAERLFSSEPEPLQAEKR